MCYLYKVLQNYKKIAICVKYLLVVWIKSIKFEAK